MDGFIVMAICIICIILSFFLCVHCYKGAKRGRVLHPPVTVTNAHITATPAIQTPYPINTPHLMPQPMAQPLHPPGLGFNGIGQGYQTAPYPLVSDQYMTPHLGSQNAPPPSYTEAMSPQLAMPQPLISENYPKQSPYNPNY